MHIFDGGRRAIGRMLLAALLGCAPAEEPVPSTPAVPMHDHSAHHGGVVSMAGDVHVEVTALPDGQVRVYLSDLRRRALAPDRTSGSIGLALAEDRLTLPLTRTADGLEARGPALPVGDLGLRVDLMHDRRPILLNVVVPVGFAPTLAALPRACSEPLGPVPRGELAPRCTVDFPRMVRVLAATADEATLLVGVFAHGVSLWRLPAAEAIGALEPDPGGHAHPGHEDPVDALAVRADGREAAVAVRHRLLRYALPGGKLVSAWPRDHYVVRTLAYTPDGRHLVATKLVDGTVELLDVEDGSRAGMLRADPPLSAAAAAADAPLVVTASERGPLSIFVPPSTAVQRVLDAGRPALKMALAGAHLVTATDDDVLSVWGLEDGRIGARSPSASPVVILATRPGNRLLASGCQDGAVRVYALPEGRLVRTLRWHGAPVQALAWAGGVLASGDSRGGLAIWNAEEIAGAGPT